MFSIVTQDGFGVRTFQVLDFDAEQVLYEWLCDVLVTKNKPEHNRIRNVKVVERFDIHKSVPSVSLANKSTNEKRQLCKQLIATCCKKKFAEVPCMNYREAA